MNHELFESFQLFAKICHFHLIWVTWLISKLNNPNQMVTTYLLKSLGTQHGLDQNCQCCLEENSNIFERKRPPLWIWIRSRYGQHTQSLSKNQSFGEYCTYARHYDPLMIWNSSWSWTADFRPTFPCFVHKLSVI